MRKAHYHTLEYEYMEKVIKLRFANSSVLDLGCGLGEYMELFNKFNCHTIGVDINPEQLSTLHKKGYNVCLPDYVPKNTKYDILFMSHVIEHMSSQDMVAFFRQWLPYMKKEGRLIVITPLGGHRFWYDFTHVRPYYPQSLWMLWGGWSRPGSDKLEQILELESIAFFNDPFKIRHGGTLGAAYYSKATNGGGGKYNNFIVKAINAILECGWRVTNGKFGCCSSWLGIYKLES